MCREVGKGKFGFQIIGDGKGRSDPDEGTIMNNTCVVFVNPFDFDRDILSNEIHSGPLYLASFVKARFGDDLAIQFLDLKIEVEKKHKVPLPQPGKWSEFLTALVSLVTKKLDPPNDQVIFAISCLTAFGVVFPAGNFELAAGP